MCDNNIYVLIRFWRWSWRSTQSFFLCGTPLSASSPPTGINLSYATRTSIGASHRSCCAAMPTSRHLLPLWTRRSVWASTPPSPTSSSTSWTLRQRRRCPLMSTGGRCTGSATRARFSTTLWATWRRQRRMPSTYCASCGWTMWWSSPPPIGTSQPAAGRLIGSAQCQSRRGGNSTSCTNLTSGSLATTDQTRSSMSDCCFYKTDPATHRHKCFLCHETMLQQWHLPLFFADVFSSLVCSTLNVHIIKDARCSKQAH